LRLANILEGRFNRREYALKLYRDLIENYPDDPWVDFARSEIARITRAIA